MSCCGNRRAAASAAFDPTTSRAPPTPPNGPGNRPARSPAGSAPGWAGAAGAGAVSVMVRYLESSPIRVHGPVTGRLYEFSGQQPVQSVERRDADALTRTRVFRRAS